MLLELFDSQIPEYWDKIKLTAIKSDGVTADEETIYCNNLLTDLLSGKKRVVMILDSSNQPKAMMIYRIGYHEIKQFEYFDITNVYGFQSQTNEEWLRMAEDLYQLARKYNCKAIKGTTTADNDRMKALFALADWEPYVCFYYKML